MEFDPKTTALVLVDMQNDFYDKDGAYPRNGLGSPEIAALPAKLVPVCDAMRAAGGWIVSTHFTVVPGKNGQPLMLDHIRKLRPFISQGDFAPGSRGHAMIDELQPADLSVDKVTYSAFYMSRLEFVLQRAGIKTCIFGGIVTNGGVSFTASDSHMRGFKTIVLSDGCAGFDVGAHESTIASLGSMVTISNCAEIIASLKQ
ncbi:MAG: cysteine hydrolase [Bosea sp.]|uniref:cysteine hydrolase family protein n=1 Tax=Bosea sp. (in: a-proteobacteria) TaxID=1871050 RepID=UPI001AD0DBE4|nr:cysteine hydrolase [Bosea sp. (in: a-proteobacteria)]MBN9453915.1 cysteine hydrolase [Bosea sp. (in: a-proteobacteria)]